VTLTGVNPGVEQMDVLDGVAGGSFDDLLSEACAAPLVGWDFSFLEGRVVAVSMIIGELTANGIVEPRRLFESPYTDRAPTGLEFLFPDADLEVMVGIIHDVKQRALPIGAA
jgi:hypothetical protein